MTIEMLLPVQISFHGLDRSEALCDLVEQETAKLEHLYRDIVSCRVAVERLAGQHRSGNPYHVRIDLAVPGNRLVVHSRPAVSRIIDDVDNIVLSKSDEVSPQHKDAALATRDAFHKLGRRLQNYARKQRGDVKTHVSQP